MYVSLYDAQYDSKSMTFWVKISGGIKRNDILFHVYSNLKLEAPDLKVTCSSRRIWTKNLQNV